MVNRHVKVQCRLWIKKPGGLTELDSASGQGHRNQPSRNVMEHSLPLQLPVSHALLHLGNQAHLIALFPMAAYAVRAPDGVIVWFNSRAAELWGRVPVIGETDERFCGAHTLYHADGTYMARCNAEVTIFRIVQECLTNIHRHSGSKTAAIRLSRTGENIYLEIQDEGKGISAEKLTDIQGRFNSQ
jgi:signal transduction histidine kinase